MPAFLLAYLIAKAPDFAISLLVEIAKRLGFVDKAEALGIKAGTHIIKVVENTKTYSSPDDFPKPAGVRN